MKKYKHKPMDSGQAAVAAALLLSIRSQLMMAISLPLCVFLLAHLGSFGAQATYVAHHEHLSSHQHQSDEINGHKHSRWQLHESGSCFHSAEAPTHTRHRRQGHQFGLSRREALESVVNRLHILESLDEQLRAFSEAAELAQRQQQAAAMRASGQILADQPESSQTLVHSTSGHTLCQLSLFRGALAGAAKLDSCLADKRLLNQIPPYMLNVYRQLLFELHQQQEERARNSTSGGQLPSASQTVHSMMPYNAQIMRSFRQPQVSLATDLGARSNGPDDDSSEQHSSKGAQFGGATRPNLVVELSALEPQPAERAAELVFGEQNNNDWSWPFAGANTEAPFKWRHSTPAELQPSRARRQPQPVQAPSEPACDLRQRLLDASRRDEICFWFNLSENFRMRANKSLEFGIKSTPGDRNRLEPVDWSSSGRADERLLEAELHVFKLFPQLAPAATQSAGSSNRSTSANSFHLKTNLLEVSLYQILPRRRTSAGGAWQPQRAGQLNQRQKQQQQQQFSDREQKAQDEFPLRLLDIRRIDLNSNGWETFYVKRAVEDWLRDARLNLGLVIKAKSMFDEPIKVGLIHFADAYDHCCRQPDARRGAHLIRGGQDSASGKLDATARRRQTDQKEAEKTLRDFDSSHQPLLVIYTTAGAAPTVLSRDGNNLAPR